MDGSLWVGCFEQLAEEVYAVLRLAAERKAEPSATILGGQRHRATHTSGERTGYGRARRKKR